MLSKTPRNPLSAIYSGRTRLSRDVAGPWSDSMVSAPVKVDVKVNGPLPAAPFRSIGSVARVDCDAVRRVVDSAAGRRGAAEVRFGTGRIAETC